MAGWKRERGRERGGGEAGGYTSHRGARHAARIEGVGKIRRF